MATEYDPNNKEAAYLDRGITPESRPRPNFSAIEMVPRLPHWRDPMMGARLPVDLTNATILRFGAAQPEIELEGGGLVIDYIANGETEERRLILSFNELGMWVTFSGRLT